MVLAWGGGSRRGLGVGGLHLQVCLFFSIHYLYMEEKKQNKTKQQRNNKATVTEEKKPQHPAHADLSMRRVSTHARYGVGGGGGGGGQWIQSVSCRGPVLAHTQIQSHTSTVQRHKRSPKYMELTPRRRWVEEDQGGKEEEPGPG